MKERTQPGRRGSERATAGAPLLEEIEAGIEAAVRRLLAKGDLTVAEVLKLREVAREMRAERPREIRVQWVRSWGDEGETGEKSGDGRSSVKPGKEG